VQEFYHPGAGGINAGAAQTMLSNFGFGGAGGDALRFGGTDIFTEAEIEEMNKKPEKVKDIWTLHESFEQLANSALSGANSLDELKDASLDMIGNLANQLAQNKIGGLGGMLLGGALQFAGNLLFNQEQKLPVKDDALDVRIVEVVENVFDFAAVRDRGQLAFQRDRYNRMNSLQQKGA